MSSRLEQRIANSSAAGARAGEGAAARAGDIEVHIAELRQIFDAMDPSPFQDRDLDPRAAEYIVGWARELPRHAPLALLIHLDRSEGLPDETAACGDAIGQFFSGRSAAARRRLKQLFRDGRVSLAVGLTFLVAAFVASQLIGRLTVASGFGALLKEGVLIGGWVARFASNIRARRPTPASVTGPRHPRRARPIPAMHCAEPRSTLVSMFVQKAREFFLHARVIARATQRPRATNDVRLRGL